MKKDELVVVSKQERQILNTVVQGLITRNMANHKVNKEWNVKDVVAHIIWYEEELVKLLTTRNMDFASPIWDLPANQRNEQIRLLSKGMSLEEILERFETVFANIIGLLEGFTDEEFVDPKTFNGMPLDWEPWVILAGSMFRHYKVHSLQLQKLLKQAVGYQ